MKTPLNQEHIDFKDISHSIIKASKDSQGVLGELKPIAVGVAGGGMSAFLSTVSTILSIIISLLTIIYLVAKITVYLRTNWGKFPKWYEIKKWYKSFKQTEKQDKQDEQ